MMLMNLFVVEMDKLKMVMQVIDDYYLIIVFQFYQNILYFLIYYELEDPLKNKDDHNYLLKKKKEFTVNWICNCLQSTSISNFKFNLKSGDECISPRTDIIPINHGFGCWKIYLNKIFILFSIYLLLLLCFVYMILKFLQQMEWYIIILVNPYDMIQWLEI